MTKIYFESQDGTVTEIEATDGLSVMQIAVQNGIPGIVAECGGSASCATCHVFVVDDPSADLQNQISSTEADLLECTAEESTQNSRLSCQIKVNPKLNGLVVKVPAKQI